MEAITHCKTPSCGERITIHNVVRERDVRGDSSRVVIIFRCPGCGVTDRLVPTRETWAEKYGAAIAEQARQDRIMKAFEIDMGLFDTVDELVTLWRSFRMPPPLEKGKDGKHFEPR